MAHRASPWAWAQVLSTPSTSVRGEAVSTKASSEAARRETESALISAILFISTQETAEKNESIKFHRKYDLWQLRFLGKIVNLFQKNTLAEYPLSESNQVKRTPQDYIN